MIELIITLAFIIGFSLGLIIRSAWLILLIIILIAIFIYFFFPASREFFSSISSHVFQIFEKLK